ncbi:solute carrier family 23 protein [Schaalia canis]|uniref:Uracil-xanthine permease n=1 Tax=Schaalia canis TaxID=100469 RepID=A0A3P1SCJ3_9ACTO|nr:solute carrier family 23 protein [Schaalia canis]RRC94769.1 uracil-xanthine permease [Schaalia canis]
MAFATGQSTHPTPSSPTVQDPVDAVPPVAKLTVLGIQHVLAFYAGAVVVPLVIASGLGLDAETTIHLINADLFTCGIASIIQSAGLGSKIGVRLPLLQGVTFTAVSPLIAIGLSAGGGVEGLATMYGAIIVAGLLTFFAAPYFAKLLRFFPPVVTGTLLTIMGTTLLAVSAMDIVRWGSDAANAEAAAAGTLKGLTYALGTLALIVLIQRIFKGFMATISVLVGLIIGTFVAWMLGDASFAGVGEAAAFGLTTPFFFGWPAFSATAILSMVIVMAITAVETTGDVFATGEIVGRRITPQHIANALRADGLSTALGGVLNSFPYTCFAQNVGLVRLSGVKSRWVITMAGAIMIVLGLLPKAGAIVASIPGPVLGGASLAMFASVAVVGIQTLSKVDLHDNRNAAIVSTSIGLALLVTLRPELGSMVPSWAQVFFGSGVTMGATIAIILNIVFFHIGRQKGEDVAVLDGKPVDLEQINAMSREDFVTTFGGMFAGDTWPVENAWLHRPFASTTDLRQAFHEAVLAASPSLQESLIGNYVDIVELVTHGSEDPQANLDIASLAAGDMSAEEREALEAVGQAYRQKFGRPLVMCVTNLTGHEQLVYQAWRRVDSSSAREARVALGEVLDIADERFNMLVADANPIRTAWIRKFDQLD